MQLFDSQRTDKSQPLAYRMRPRTLDEYIGQDHIIGPGRLLRRAIQADQLSSVIFYGPPGTGKTTLARVIANTTKSHFSTLNAVLSGVKELREEIDAAKQRLDLYARRTILFVDEVHRWNKSQQDALLPWVENGTFILIGATTENPFFEVNAALVSRSRIFQLKPLTDENLKDIAIQAINDDERGYGKLNVVIDNQALDHLVEVAHGDARSLLNALELAVETTQPENGTIKITREVAEESIQKKAVLYDKEGDYHFDVISAFIKSLRGSDPDAALYWLAKMVNAGEDPKFIFRRMMISACEDVGLADPNAIVVVTSDAQAFNMVGMPEGCYHLTHAALYLSTAPKSNSALAFFDALKGVEEESRAAEVPNHLRDASRDSKEFGHGQGYMYPHAYREHWVAQQYLPAELQGKIFYQPTDIGYEAKIKDNLERHRELQLESVDVNAFPENLTYSPLNKDFDLWLRRVTQGRSQALEKIKNSIIENADIIRSDRILVLNPGHGLLVWEALRRTPEGLTVALADNPEDNLFINNYIQALEWDNKPVIAKDFSEIDENIKFEHILGRNLFVHDSRAIEIVNEKLACSGSFVTCETLIDEGSRLSGLIHEGSLKNELAKAEKHIYNISYRQQIKETLSRAFSDVSYSDISFTEQKIITPDNVQRWIQRTYAAYLNQNNIQDIIDQLTYILCKSPVNWHTSCLLAKAKK